MIQFYKKYNPVKLDTVDATLANYRGKEETLFRKLEQKYVSGKDGMLPPAGTGPQCFMDFSVDGQSIGRVIVQLFADKAPLASENFRCLCTGEKGKGASTKDLCYRSSKIHRLVPGMCIQGGDFTKGNGTGGESIYPPNSEHGDMWGKFKDETPFLIHSKKGLLSMANNGPNRNGSQFFFTLKPLPYLDGKHVVFGDVVQGMEVLDEINKLESDKKQRPILTLMIEDCGQLGEDGKEIRSGSSYSKTAQQTSTPFGGAFGVPQQAPSSGQSSSNPFASFSLSSARKSASKGTGSVFSFGATSEPTTSKLAATVAKSSFSFGPPAESSKPGGASSEPATSQLAVTVAKSSFSFGQQPATSQLAGTVAKSSFTFGPLAGTSNPGGASTQPATSKLAGTVAKSSFSFGPPALPSKPDDASSQHPTSKLAGTVAKSSFSFGPPSGSSGAFSFGQSTTSEKSPFSAVSSKQDTAAEGGKNDAFSFGSGSAFSASSASPSPFGQQTDKSENKPASQSVFGSFPKTTTTSFSLGSGASQPVSAAKTSAESSILGSVALSAAAASATAAAKPFATPFSIGMAEKKTEASKGKSGATTSTATFSFGKVEEPAPPKLPSTTKSASNSVFSFGKTASQKTIPVHSSVTPNPASATASQATPTTSTTSESSFSANKARQPDGPVEKSPKPAEPASAEPASKTSTTTFSFGKPPKPENRSEAGTPKATAFSFRKVTEALPTQPASSRKGTPSPAKPLLPSFYFGEDKSVTVGESSPTVKGVGGASELSPARSGSINLDRELAKAEEPKVGVANGETETDVSFASFSPSFIKSSAKISALPFKGFAPVPDNIMKAVGGSREGVTRAHVSPSKNGSWSQTQSKPAKTKANLKSAQKLMLGGIIPSTTFSPSAITKRPKEVEDAVADILAERVFYEDELLSKVSVEQVEWLMAAPLERKIEVLEHIDSIEIRGEAFTWKDIEFVLKNGRSSEAESRDRDLTATKSSNPPAPDSSNKTRTGDEIKLASFAPDNSSNLPATDKPAKTSSEDRVASDAICNVTLEVRNDGDRARTSSSELKQMEKVGIKAGVGVKKTLHLSTSTAPVTMGVADNATSSHGDDLEVLLLNLETLN